MPSPASGRGDQIGEAIGVDVDGAQHGERQGEDRRRGHEVRRAPRGATTAGVPSAANKQQERARCERQVSLGELQAMHGGAREGVCGSLAQTYPT